MPGILMASNDYELEPTNGLGWVTGIKLLFRRNPR